MNTSIAIKTVMAPVAPIRLSLLLGAALVALAETSWGQKPSTWPVNMRAYRVADGMPESACISVTLAPPDKVLARHLKSTSITQLDGYMVRVLPGPATGHGRVYESPAGQLWTVVAEGLQEFRNGEWVLHPVPEIAAEFRARVPPVTDPIPLLPVRQGVVLLLLPGRLLEFNTEDPELSRTDLLLAADQTRLERFSGMTPARDGGLWLAGERGLAKISQPIRNLKQGGEWHDYLPPEPFRIHNLQQPHAGDEGIVTVLAEATTNNAKTLLHFDGQSWTAEAVPVERSRYAWRGPDQTDWAASVDSVFEWKPGVPGVLESEEGPTRQCYGVAVERSGAFWLATSDGLFRYAPFVWRGPSAAQSIRSPIRCLAGDEAGRLWLISGNGLQLLQNNRYEEFPLPSSPAAFPASLRALFPLKDGTLLLDAGAQSVQFKPDTGTFAAAPPMHPAGPFYPLGPLRDGRLVVLASSAGAADQNIRLETFDGAKFEPLSVPPPERLPGDSLSTLFATQMGDLWLSGDRGTARYHDRKWQTFPSADASGPESVVAFAEFPDGRIWCATQEKVWGFDGKSWSVVRLVTDRINGLIATRDGGIWVAADSGLHRFFQGAWIENGTEEGLPSGGVRGLYEDSRGRVWAATAHGLSLYHPEADPDPPRTFVEVLGDREKDIPEGGTISLLFNALDKWKYTPRQRLLYSYQLNGRDWSPFQEDRAVSFTDLPAGKHYLQVRAMDRNCNVDPNPARLEFVVMLPWYKESRLVWIAIAGLAVALFFAGLAFNRHRQLLRSYAAVEQKVAERTRELESANRQLLHSQKMNALGTLAAGIAHDFNNILSIVKGSAQIIEDNLDKPEKVRTRVDRIKTVVEQGAGIVKAMLGFSRDSSEQPGPCDLNAVLDDTLKLLGDRFLHEVNVTLERAPGLPEVLCSKDFVQQVLLNFILNAAESMAKRKQIILATCPLDKLPANLVLAPATATGYVAVSVQDFGCGISPENLPRIFEPFFTTKGFSARRGTGLGLSMAYELARKMEAGIAVETAVDQGSTFTLILPVRDLITS
jgi:signal transduction histidine kinase